MICSKEIRINCFNVTFPGTKNFIPTHKVNNKHKLSEKICVIILCNFDMHFCSHLIKKFTFL